jgi:hypothetical protein
MFRGMPIAGLARSFFATPKFVPQTLSPGRRVNQARQARCVVS